MNVIIIGRGKSEDATIQILAETVSIEILGIAIEPENKESIELANALGIPIWHDCKSLLERTDVELIVDLSDSKEVSEKLLAHSRAGVDIIDHSTARLICQLLQSESRKTHEIIDNLTREHWSLFEIGTSLSSAKDLSEVSRTIIKQATKLTNTPAGSLAVYDEKSGEMFLAASIGFKEEMATQESWRLRNGGLTRFILNQKGPIVISNLEDHPEFDNPRLAYEDIRSLIACPLILDGKVVGIIYVDDFRTRAFTEREISILCLLATYAAIAIEKAKLLEETKLLAVTDDLTKLYNHRYLVQQLTAEISRAERYREPLSFIIIDIDHFKRYNDTNGHVKGNEVLRQLAGILRNESRLSDIIARYGGEEFTVICPKTDKQNTYMLAERLRQKIEIHDFPEAHNQPSGRLTVSVGVASYPEDSTEAIKLIEKADTALYLAKNNGRNCVRIYSEQ